MSKVIILLFVLLSRFAIATDAVNIRNPVSKFLMNRGTGHGGGDDAELIATKTALAEQIKAAKVAGEQALRDTEAASAALTSLQQDMEELKKDNEVRIQQMSQSSDAALQVAQVQEQAATRIEEVKARGDRELAEAKEANAKREDEIKAQYERDYLDFTNAMNEKEAELKSQHERALAEAADANAQIVAELTKTIEKESEMVASAVEKDTELVEANVALAKKNEELTTRLQELEALWQDSSQTIDAGKEEVRVQLQQEIADMTAKNSEEILALEGRLSALQQERNELKQLSLDQEQKTSQMQEESHQALNAALAEHEKEVEGLHENVAAAIMARKNIEKQTKKLESSIATFKKERDDAKQVSSGFRFSIISRSVIVCASHNLLFA
jgi:chromosome segregation ATPase